MMPKGYRYPDTVDFDAKKVRELLDAKDISVSAVAEFIGCSKNTLEKNLQRGRINYYNLDKLSVFFCRHMSEFTMGSNN